MHCLSWSYLLLLMFRTRKIWHLIDSSESTCISSLVPCLQEVQRHAMRLLMFINVTYWTDTPPPVSIHHTQLTPYEQTSSPNCISRSPFLCANTISSSVPRFHPRTHKIRFNWPNQLRSVLKATAYAITAYWKRNVVYLIYSVMHVYSWCDCVD